MERRNGAQFLQGRGFGNPLGASWQGGAMENDIFRLWVMGCSHLSTDLRYGRESLLDAIRQSECGGDEGGPPFEWDLALHLGDICGGQDVDGDGRSDLLIGARGHDGGAENGGAVFLSIQPPSGASPVADADAILLGAIGGMIMAMRISGARRLERSRVVVRAETGSESQGRRRSTRGRRRGILPITVWGCPPRQRRDGRNGSSCAGAPLIRPSLAAGLLLPDQTFAPGRHSPRPPLPSRSTTLPSSFGNSMRMATMSCSRVPRARCSMSTSARIPT